MQNQNVNSSVVQNNLSKQKQEGEFFAKHKTKQLTRTLEKDLDSIAKLTFFFVELLIFCFYGPKFYVAVTVSLVGHLQDKDLEERISSKKESFQKQTYSTGSEFQPDSAYMVTLSGR
ncbi:unnamed protein product [Rhizophagus irregularis]|nr:unnamed protein product [Rhizophagus irregularis]